eukprot:SAG11_NODE_38054_length_254_cov_0.658065_1_plen_25_part_01
MVCEFITVKTCNIEETTQKSGDETT